VTAEAVAAGMDANVKQRSYPNAEEMRMVRAIALLALLEALRHGEYRATFHGFRVEAHRRPGHDNAKPTVEVSLTVRLAGHVVERSELAIDTMPSSFGRGESYRSVPDGAETFGESDGH